MTDALSSDKEQNPAYRLTAFFFFIYLAMVIAMSKLDIKEIKTFLLDDIWRVTDDEVSKKRGMIYNAIKIVTLSIKEFTERRVVNKASALTYNTLLAIIPILAILFAIARGFGFANLLEDQFRSGLSSQAQAAETILSFIDSY